MVRNDRMLFCRCLWTSSNSIWIFGWWKTGFPVPHSGFETWHKAQWHDAFDLNFADAQRQHATQSSRNEYIGQDVETDQIHAKLTSKIQCNEMHLSTDVALAQTTLPNFAFQTVFELFWSVLLFRLWVSVSSFSSLKQILLLSLPFSICWSSKESKGDCQCTQQFTVRNDPLSVIILPEKMQIFTSVSHQFTLQKGIPHLFMPFNSFENIWFRCCLGHLQRGMYALLPFVHHLVPLSHRVFDLLHYLLLALNDKFRTNAILLFC